MSNENPWKELHVADEVEMQDGNRRLARALVEMEWAGAPDSLPCPCGGELHFRATIGGRKCPSCGQVARTDGTLVGSGRCGR